MQKLNSILLLYTECKDEVFQYKSHITTMNNKSAIQKFYQDQVIFITGGTGFVGKVLIEKLLRTCDLKKIYILVRAKKNKTPEERFQELFSIPCFERLHSERIEYKSKVVLINGNCEEANLGLTEKDYNVLIEQVTVVIHAAANVKFNQSLRTSAINLSCTMDILAIAAKMKALKSFVYVSTAFSNCIDSHIKEKIYEPPMIAEKFMDLVSLLNDDALDVLTPKLLNNWPNTYVYTKCITEDYIRRLGKGLPIIIVRPAIITSSAEEPLPGWVDNFYGIIGLLIGGGLGAIKSLLVKFDAAVQIVPVDYVVNQIIAAVGTIEMDNENIGIYNYCPHPSNLFYPEQFYGLLLAQLKSIGLSKQILAATMTLTESKLWHEINIFFLHTCFSYFADVILFCIGREPIAVKSYQRINRQLELTSYFATRNWEFDNYNVQKLWKHMSEEDKRLFNFDMETLNWKQYLSRGSLGGRVHLMKDPLETVPQAVRKQKISLVIHYVVIALFWYLVYKLIALLIELLM